MADTLAPETAAAQARDAAPATAATTPAGSSGASGGAAAGPAGRSAGPAGPSAAAGGAAATPGERLHAAAMAMAGRLGLLLERLEPGERGRRSCTL